MIFGAARSALSRQPIGQECSWPAVAPFTSGAKVTLTDFATAPAGKGGCKAIEAKKADEFGTIAKFISMMGAVSEKAQATCGGVAMAMAPAPTMPPIMNFNMMLTNVMPPTPARGMVPTPAAGKTPKAKAPKGKKAGKTASKGKKTMTMKGPGGR
jgi:hypothetical protein